MSASIAIPFLHPSLITLIVVVAAVVGFSGPADLRARRWWMPAMLGLGAVVGGLAVLAKLVPLTGTMHLSAYAACMVAGFALAFALMRRRVPLLRVRQAWLVDCFLIALVLGVVGARGRYVYERWDAFTHDAQGAPIPLTATLVRAADLDRGGAVWYGGLILATVGVIWYCRRRSIALLPMADLTTPALLAGLAVGRIGCFLNGCCYGQASDLPWCLPSRAAAKAHPTQLYETLACGLLAAGLWWWWRRRTWNGQIACAGVLGYGLWRFLNEGLRGDHDAYAWGGAVTTSQATSVYLAIGAIIAWIILVRRPRPMQPLPGTWASSAQRLRIPAGATDSPG